VPNTEGDYRILEIETSATNEELKKAYRRMAMKYHPDKVSNLGEDFQKAAHEKFQSVNKAYENIKKERKIV
jgi:DnaJ like chaperone protein